MIGALLLATVFFGVRYRREVMQAIRDWIGLWLAWFEGDRESASSNEDDAKGQQPDLAPTFASLSNPFQGSDPDRVVRQLYQAAVIWGGEHRVLRREDETPEEYLVRLGRKYREVSESLAQLGWIYSRMAYAQKHARRDEVEALRPLWNWFKTNAAPPVPAAAIL